MSEVPALEIDVLNQVPITRVPCPSSTLKSIIFRNIEIFRKEKKFKFKSQFFFAEGKI
jgi:hypothetical protein